MNWRKKATGCLLALLAGAAAQAQNHSVLATGDWWRMEVQEAGIYRLTTGDLPALAGVAVSNIAVYGGDGKMLSMQNSQTPITDLQELAIDVRDKNDNGLFDSEDEVLFYGEGAGGWSYDNSTGRWRYEQHPYANANYYFITTTATGGKRIATVAAVTAVMTLNRNTVVAHYENELANMYGSGQVWVGEKLTSALTSRTFNLRLNGTGIGEVKVRWAVASTSGGRFSLSTTGYNGQVMLTTGLAHSSVEDIFSTTRNNFDFTLSYQPGESSAVGYLDYIELNANAQLSFSGPQTEVRIAPQATPTTQFAMSGATGVRVWDVTTAGEEREMTVSDGNWSDSTSRAHLYIAFDGTGYLAPRAVESLAHQDLHGSPAAELVIVTHPLFLEQARRLAGLHELFDGMNVLTVTDAEVFNEFSSGKQDPMAIRSLMRWLKTQYPANPPRYLLLFGKGSYDNRNLMGQNGPIVVTYETPASFDGDGVSFAGDDLLGYLSETGRGATSEPLDASVGRLPAKSVEEAVALVDKLEAYMTRRDLADESQRGDWRNFVALLADDADPAHPGDTLFAHSSEVVARNIKQAFPQLNVDRFYADAYHQQSGAIGSYYPDLNNALRQRINYGCLLLNYIGHGSTAYIGTERYIELSDVAAYSNTDRLPLFVTSTCSYGRYDQPDDICGAEACVLAPAAMIAVISASRPISHIERFNNDVVRFALDPANAIGDALRLAKNRTQVSQSIGILGDPALRLSQPQYRVRVTHINGTPVEGLDSIQATVLSRVTVRGEIVDSTGARVQDFDGTIFPVVYDREVSATTLANDNPGTQVRFNQQKNILYRGSHNVSQGQFEYSFIVPQDVSYRYDYAKLSHYAKSGSEDASGCYTKLMFGGMNDSVLAEITPPTVRLFMGDTTFMQGGITSTTPTLLAMLSDSAGINVGSGLGHDITAVLDGNPNSLIVLNDLYQPDISDGRCGSVRYALSDLTPGRHTITVKAWNIYALSGSDTLTFMVHSADTLVLSKLACWPNPASEYTTFHLEVNSPESLTSAEFQIYNSRGQMMHSLQPSISADGYSVGPVRWDVSNIPPGLYLARMIVTDKGGKTHQATTKCIVR